MATSMHDSYISHFVLGNSTSEPLLGRFCGDREIPKNPIYTTGSALTVTFTSNSTRTYRGLLMTVTAGNN